jgi:hypothetical protein
MGAPIPWQQFIKPPLREVGDSGEHVGKPGLWVDVVELGRHDVAMTAARSAPRSEPANSQDLRPKAKPRKARSAALLVRQDPAVLDEVRDRSHRLSM